MSPGRASLVALLLGAFWACSTAEPTPCAAAIAAADHDAVVSRCVGEPDVLLARVRAHLHRREYQAVIELARAGPGHPDEGEVWRLVARAHDRQRERESAISALERALTLHQDTPAQLARDAQELAGVHHRAGDYQAALRWMRTAEQATVEAGDRRMMGFVQLALASIAYEVGDARGAEHALRLAEAFLNRPADLAWVALKLGILAREQGQAESARLAFDRAEQHGAGGARPEVLRSLALNRAMVDRDQGRLDQAAARMAQLRAELAERPDPRFDTALTVNQAIVARLRGRTAEAAQFLERVAGTAAMPEFHWRIAHEQGLLARARGDRAAAAAALEAAIEHIERMRGELGADELKGWFLEVKRGPYEALFRLHVQAGDHRAAFAVQERTNARMFLDAFIAQAESMDAGARAAQLKGVVAALAEQATPATDAILAAAQGKTVLAYQQAEGVWYRTRVGADGPVVEALGIKPEQLERLVRRWRARLDDDALAAELGAALIPPGLPSGRLYIVPTGTLSELPFAALGREDVLVERHEIAVLPSVATLVAPARSGAGAAVWANPTGDLPHAEVEGRQVAGVLGVPPRLGRAASADALPSLAGVQIAHLATHAGLGATGAWLQLADRRVGADELVRGRIAPEVVVLASCASGASPNRALWGSLGAAFLAAGSTTAIVSLQSVEDAVARQLFERFYAAGGRDDPVGALARAQRALRGTLSPAQWGLFAAVGAR